MPSYVSDGNLYRQLCDRQHLVRPGLGLDRPEDRPAYGYLPVVSTLQVEVQSVGQLWTYEPSAPDVLGIRIARQRLPDRQGDGYVCQRLSPRHVDGRRTCGMG